MSELDHSDAQSFARVLSHDLAALVRSARQLSAYVREDVLREDADSAMHALGMMDVRLANIDRFVAELIRYHRAGDRMLRPEQFSLTELVQSVFAKVVRDADAKLRLTCSRDIIVSDLDLLKGVLGEIIGNAVRYHDDAAPLTLDVEITESTENTTLVVIADNGPGVPDGFLNRILDPFIKFGGRSGSAGLGLAICRRDIESVGGSITVRENEPRGLAVQLVLPSGLENALDGQRPTIRRLSDKDRPTLKIV